MIENLLIKILSSVLDEDAVFGYADNPGYINQIFGVILKAKKTDNFYEKVLIKNNYSHPIRLEYFDRQKKFESAIKKTLDNFFKDRKKTPKLFVMPYSASDTYPLENIETWANVVKKYYKDNDLGEIKTVVLTANLHDYKSPDFIHIPNHTLTLEDENKLSKLKVTNPDLAKKIIVTEGIVHHVNEQYIKVHYNSDKMQKFVKDNNLDNSNPKVVFVLGGKTNDGKIVFDIKVGKKIVALIKKMQAKGKQVIVTNSARTPEDVCDYIYEQSKKIGFIFANFKPIATSDGDKDNWIKYNGKYKKEFEKDIEDYGSIYPGIFYLDNVCAVHTSDTYACCETASSGVPVGIFEIPIDKKARPDCIKLKNTMLDKGYALKAEDFVEISPNDAKLKLNKMIPQGNKLMAKLLNLSGFIKKLN